MPIKPGRRDSAPAVHVTVGIPAAVETDIGAPRSTSSVRGGGGARLGAAGMGPERVTAVDTSIDALIAKDIGEALVDFICEHDGSDECLAARAHVFGDTQHRSQNVTRMTAESARPA